MCKQWFYLRVSTPSRGDDGVKQREQTFERQKGILERAGYTLTDENTFAERISGKTKNDEREQFDRLLSSICAGDWVIFSETSRFSRSYINGMEMLDILIFDKNVNVRFVSNGIDLLAGERFNPCLWFSVSQMLLSDELQRRIISYNTANGLKAKKENGIILGRPNKSNALKQTIISLSENGKKGKEIAEELGISAATVSRILKEKKNEQGKSN